MREYRSADDRPPEEGARTVARTLSDVLLPLLRAVLTGGDLPPLTLTPELVSFCTAQQLIGFLHHALRCGGEVENTEQAALVKKSYSLSVAQQIQQDYYRERIFASLTAAGIPYLPLKGESLRAVYPSPDLRFSCDVDFFYPKEYRAGVHAILTECGFQKQKSDPHNDSYVLGAVHIEPHFALSDGEENCEKYYADIWSRLVAEDGTRYRFTPEDTYVYLLLHAYKHFVLGGAGVRSVADAWLWKKAHPDMDGEVLGRGYRELGITRFAAQYERLGRVWFEGEPGDADTDMLTQYLCAGGAYGTLEQGALMGLASRGQSKRMRFSYVFRRVFLPYRQLRLQYPILWKIPVLYPFCTVLRWFRVLFSKDRKHVRRDLSVAGGIQPETAERARQIWDLIH